MTESAYNYLSSLYNEVQQAWKIWPHDNQWKMNLYKSLQEIETTEANADEYLKRIFNYIKQKQNGSIN